jgi:hypothetical protein
MDKARLTIETWAVRAGKTLDGVTCSRMKVGHVKIGDFDFIECIFRCDCSELQLNSCSHCILKI